MEDTILVKAVVENAIPNRAQAEADKAAMEVQVWDCQLDKITMGPPWKPR